ncbi:hypothetical protein EYF80_066230 [Liparis tanakae]|uniref:Uncharacterized protein n=1 Tax=Liparis tanakae TaxID=230148 RepID=A0A4Z2E4G1_9TELE|nr:hypothetical protein EYF80_066230 [Liparis tanakae]
MENKQLPSGVDCTSTLLFSPLTPNSLHTSPAVPSVATRCCSSVGDGSAAPCREKPWKHPPQWSLNVSLIREQPGRLLPLYLPSPAAGLRGDGLHGDGLHGDGGDKAITGRREPDVQ